MSTGLPEIAWIFSAPKLAPNPRIWSIARSSSQTMAGRIAPPCSSKRPKVSRWFEMATPAMRAGSTFVVISRSARNVERHQSSGSCSK